MWENEVVMNLDKKRKIQMLEEEIFQDKQKLNNQLWQIENSYQNACSCFNQIIAIEEECCKINRANIQNNLNILEDYNDIRICFAKKKDATLNYFKDEINSKQKQIWNLEEGK